MSHELLWIAPNLNHYKARFLNRLADRDTLRLTVLAGRGQTSLGHRNLQEKYRFRCIEVPVQKGSFAFSWIVYTAIVKAVRQVRPSIVLMPAERRFIPLIVTLSLLRRAYGYRLVSYNHPILRSDHVKIRRRDLLVTRIVYGLYDRIIFYTEQSRDLALARNLLPEEKADYANNTLDTGSIWQEFVPEPEFHPRPHILFLGRLVKSKRLDDLFRYYGTIKHRIPELKLTIIGDGPEADVVQKAAERDQDIQWTGAITSEPVIASIMKQVSVVFVPGLSGLSIVHAFAYGKPYVTLASPGHGPEIDYVVSGHNGLLLSGNLEADCVQVVSLLQDEQRYLAMSRAARETAQRLSVDHWLTQMESALLMPTRNSPR